MQNNKKFLLIYIVITFVLTACVPTPTEEAIVHKDQQQMLQQAQTTIENEDLDTLYDRLEAPTHIDNTFTDKSGRIKICLNAEVELPESELPIIRVRPIDFTMDKIISFAEVLMPEGSKYVNFDKDKPRGYYNYLIQNLSWAIENWDEGGHNMYVDYDSVTDAENALSRLLLQQSNAPETAPEIDPKTIVTTNGYPAEGFYQLIATSDNKAFSMLHVKNLSREYGISSIEYLRDQFYNYFVSDGRIHQGAEPSQEVISEADRLIKDLPIDGFECYSVFPDVYFGNHNELTQCYHFIYTRAFNHVSETATDVETVMGGYSRPWGYEMIHIIMDEAGVAAFKYMNPYAIEEIVCEKTNLLHFSEIQSIFNKRITVYHNDLWDGNKDGINYIYNITRVQLGLVSVQAENDDTGLLVPAWDFLGHICYADSDKEGYYNGNQGLLHSFITINAIDGSIISRGDI